MSDTPLAANQPVPVAEVYQKLLDKCERDLAAANEQIATLNAQLYDHDKAAADEIAALKAERDAAEAAYRRSEKSERILRAENERLRSMLAQVAPWVVGDQMWTDGERLERYRIIRAALERK